MFGRNRPAKPIKPAKLVFLFVAIAVAAGIFISVVSNITHSFDVLNAPASK